MQNFVCVCVCVVSMSEMFYDRTELEPANHHMNDMVRKNRVCETALFHLNCLHTVTNISH